MFQQVRGKWEITAASGRLGPDRCVLGWGRAEPQFLCGGRGGAADLTVSAPGVLGAEGGQQGALARLDVLVTQLNASTGNGRAV